MRNRFAWRCHGILAAWALFLLLGSGFLVRELEAASGAMAAGTEHFADRTCRSFIDDTEAPQEGGSPDADDEHPSRDETPQPEDAPELPFGGCIFDRKPLQLMV